MSDHLPVVRTEFTEDLQRAYLENLKEMGNKSAAAASVGVSYDVVSHYSTKNKQFREAEEMCRKLSLIPLEAEARKRALEGSDKLLMFLLQANDRDRFAHGHANTGTTNIVNINGDSALDKLSVLLKVNPKDIAQAEKQIYEGEYEEAEGGD